MLDLGGRRGGLAPARGLDDVGVVVGELERRGALLGDVLERADRRADAQQQPDDAPAQPQRLGDAARQAPLQRARRSTGRPSGTISGPSAGGASRVSGKSSEPARRMQLRAVDVDDVQRDGDARGAAGLGHELIGDQVRRDLVEDVGDLERERLGAAEAAGRLVRERGQLPRRLARGAGLARRRSACSARAARRASRVAKWR